jgi:hypothetical protein
MARLALGAVGLVIGVLAVLALREATLSKHERVPRDSRMEVVVTADMRGAEQNQSLEEMVEAVLTACRLEVASDITEPQTMGSNRFRAVLQPALDDTNRRQFRGCVEDWTIDQVRVDVVRFSLLP